MLHVFMSTFTLPCRISSKFCWALTKSHRLQGHVLPWTSSSHNRVSETDIKTFVVRFVMCWGQQHLSNLWFFGFWAHCVLFNSGNTVQRERGASKKAQGQRTLRGPCLKDKEFLWSFRWEGITQRKRQERRFQWCTVHADVGKGFNTGSGTGTEK